MELFLWHRVNIQLILPSVLLLLPLSPVTTLAATVAINITVVKIVENDGKELD